MTVIEINKRQVSAKYKGRSFIKVFFFYETPDSNHKLLSTLRDEKRKDGKAVNSRGRRVQGHYFD